MCRRLRKFGRNCEDAKRKADERKAAVKELELRQRDQAMEGLRMGRTYLVNRRIDEVESRKWTEMKKQGTGSFGLDKKVGFFEDGVGLKLRQNGSMESFKK